MLLFCERMQAIPVTHNRPPDGPRWSGSAPAPLAWRVPWSCRRPFLDGGEHRVEQPREAPPADLRQPPLAVYELDFATVDMPGEEPLEPAGVRDVGAADAWFDALEDAVVELADRQAGTVAGRAIDPRARLHVGRHAARTQPYRTIGYSGGHKHELHLDLEHAHRSHP